ncbi:MAG: hypothetical protein JWQ83_1342 [Lacunisphaera sp.]|nr:hypothetical protein [Lacunisphaera sp.]
MKHTLGQPAPFPLLRAGAFLFPLLSFAQITPPPSSAAEQNRDEPLTLSVFEVRAARDEGYRVENSVSTTGIAQSLMTTPLPISVITEQFLKDAGLEGFAGSLRYVSSLSFDPHTADGNNPPGAVSGGSVGNGNPNLNRFRGQPFNGTYRNGLRLEYGFYTENVDRIEVAKGPMAVFIGGATLGGEVNVITKKPVFHSFNEVVLRVGSHDSYLASIDSTGPITKTLAYRVIASVNDRNSWRDYSAARVVFANPQLLWRPSEKASIRLDVQYRRATGNLVSQNTASTKNYQSAFDNPPAALLALGTRTLGRPFTVTEYRNRIGQAFGTWRQDVFDTSGSWVTLGTGEGLSEGNAPDGRQYNYYGPHAPFETKVGLIESEATLVATSWLNMRLLGRYVKTNMEQQYYWFGSRIYAGGNTPLISGDSLRLDPDENYAGKFETVFKKDVLGVKGTLLLGAQASREDRTLVLGRWDYTQMPAVPASPNVFGSPATLTGQNVFTFFDPAVQAFPDTRLAQRWADDVLPAGTTSRAFRRSWAQAANAAASAEYKRLILTGGFRRDRNSAVSDSLDRNDDLVFVGGAPQIVRGPRVYTNSWMAGAVFKVTNGINAYASYNYGETYQSGSLVSRTAFAAVPAIVTAAEIAANPLPNATGAGKEIGLKFNVLKNKLTGSIGWFNLVRGGIPVTDSGRTALDPRNQGTEVDPNPATANPAVRYRVGWTEPVKGNSTGGFETDWIWTPTTNYSLVFGASHLTKNKLTVDRPDSEDPTVLRTFLVLNGRPLENTPDDTVRVFQRYQFTSGALNGFSTGLGVRYQSSVQPSANDANWGLLFPGFYVADLTLGYKTKAGHLPVNLLLSVTNLTNHTYFEGNRVYGAPREYAFTVRTDF